MSVWAVGTMLWFYHRKHIMSLVLVHAVTNGSILAFAVLGPLLGWQADRAGLPFALVFAGGLFLAGGNHCEPLGAARVREDLVAFLDVHRENRTWQDPGNKCDNQEKGP